MTLDVTDCFKSNITFIKLDNITSHGDNFENLRKIYHPDLLPEDFGGNLGPISSKHYREDLLEFMGKLKQEHLAKIAAKN